MEAIHEFEIRDMPVTVAVDSTGESVHETGPRIWRERITGGAPRTREIQLRSEISEIALGLMLKSPSIGR